MSQTPRVERAYQITDADNDTLTLSEFQASNLIDFFEAGQCDGKRAIGSLRLSWSEGRTPVVFAETRDTLVGVEVVLIRLLRAQLEADRVPS